MRKKTDWRNRKQNYQIENGKKRWKHYSYPFKFKIVLLAQ